MKRFLQHVPWELLGIWKAGHMLEGGEKEENPKVAFGAGNKTRLRSYSLSSSRTTFFHVVEPMIMMKVTPRFICSYVHLD